MRSETKNMAQKLDQLKEARLQLLRIHKLLIDIERENFEKQTGLLTSGQFLGLLLDDPDLQWLRKFSTLIVEIDEMLDLDDGFSEGMIQNQLSAIKNLIDFDGLDREFEERYKNSIQRNPQVALKHGELKNFMT